MHVLCLLRERNLVSCLGKQMMCGLPYGAVVRLAGGGERKTCYAYRRTMRR